eukprot:Clim_evm1s179 gene=Clim_evmTU1s179
MSVNDLVLAYTNAFLYLYPLVSMDATHSTYAVDDNTFDHKRAFPPADFRQVVRPNFDTLYSTMWGNVELGPAVLTMPEKQDDKLVMLQMLDMYTDTFATPSNTNQGDCTQFFIHLPTWKGVIPEGMCEIVTPTASFWLLGRLQSDGTDYEFVNDLQDQLDLDPLDNVNSTLGEDLNRIRPQKLALAPKDDIRNLTAYEYFEYGLNLMEIYGTHATDFDIAKSMQNIGLTLEGIEARNPSQTAAMVMAKKLAYQIMDAPLDKDLSNGWSYNTAGIGVYGNGYDFRAVVAHVGLGANPPTWAIYPVLEEDSDGEAPTGDEMYRFHFEQDDIPPAKAFWSITMYDEEGFPVPNEINRQAIGSMTQGLVYNADGSLDIYMGAEKPVDPERAANWLPSPANGPIGVTMRIYLPSIQAQKGNYVPPAAVKFDYQNDEVLESGHYLD